MKKLISYIVAIPTAIIVLISYLTIVGQVNGVPVPAAPMICQASSQVPESKIVGAIIEVKDQGCNNARWDHIPANNTYVVYGTKVLIGE